MKFKLFLWFLALLTLTVWGILLQLPDGRLHIITCDVGQGDAMLIRTPSGKDILIDAGRDERILDCLGSFLPFYDKTIEVLVLTHGDQDHVGGTRHILTYYDAVNVFASQESASIAFGDVRPKNIIEPDVGDTVFLDGVTVEFLWPPFAPSDSREASEGQERNNHSIVHRIIYKELSGLFTGDIDAETLTTIDRQKDLSNSFFLKVPHHGSRFGLDANIAGEIRPVVSTVSVGKNSYGHPTETILSLLKNVGSTIFRTDERGNIDVSSDGSSWSVKTQR